jgi:predicted phosphoribosyltransferase
VIRLAHIDESTFKTVCDDELAEIERRRQRYLGTQARLEIGGCTAIVVEIATGATMRAALRATRTRNPKKLVLAAPVAPTSTLDELRGEADDIVCLEFFGAIGFYYRGFSQISDEEVIDILKQFSRRLNGTKEPAA